MQDSAIQLQSLARNHLSRTAVIHSARSDFEELCRSVGEPCSPLWLSGNLCKPRFPEEECTILSKERQRESNRLNAQRSVLLGQAERAKKDRARKAEFQSFLLREAVARENERTRHKNEVQKLKAILDNTEEEPPKGEEGMRDIDDGLEGSMENGSQEDLLQAPPSALLLSQEVDNGDVLTQEDDGNADSQADDSLESVEEVTTFDRSVQSAIEVVERGVGDGVVSFEDSSQEMVEGKVKQEEDKAEEIKIEEKMAIEKYEEVHEDNVDKEHVVTKDDGDEGEIAKEKEDKEVEGKQEQLKEVKEQFEELVEEHKVEKVEKNTEDEKVGKEEQDEVKMEERVEGKKVKEKEERIEEEKAEEGNVEEKVENEEVVEDEKVLEYMVQEVNVEEKVEKVEEDKVKEEVKFEEGKVEEEIAEEEKGGQEKQVEEIDGEDSAGKDYREDLNKLADINISQETVVVEEKNSAPIPSCCPEDHDHQTKFAIDICDLVNRNWELMSSADLLAYQIQITKDLAVTKASILQRRKHLKANLEP